MVETYFNQELSDITFEVEALDEWKIIASELGLDKQLALTKGKGSPVQYPFMNEVMKRVYETLCSRKVCVSDYNATPIPLEVLRLIALSTNDKTFDRIEIWYDDKKDDPLAVGVTCKYWCYIIDPERGPMQFCDDKGRGIYGTKEELTEKASAKGLKVKEFYSTEESNYLIARWGDELRDFATLKKLAIERFMGNEGGEMKKKVAELTQKLNILKENTVSYFNGNASKYEVTNNY